MAKNNDESCSHVLFILNGGRWKVEGGRWKVEDGRGKVRTWNVKNMLLP